MICAKCGQDIGDWKSRLTVVQWLPNGEAEIKYYCLGCLEELLMNEEDNEE